MNKQIETTPLINTWMNSQRQFWDLWFAGVNPLIEIESKLLHVKDNKVPEDYLHKLTNTILDEQEKMLVSFYENFSKAAGQNNGLINNETFEFWKKELKSIGELEKKSLLELSPLFNPNTPLKMLERMKEFSSMMNKSVEAMGDPVSMGMMPERRSNSTKQSADAPQRRLSDTH